MEHVDAIVRRDKTGDYFPIVFQRVGILQKHPWRVYRRCVASAIVSWDITSGHAFKSVERAAKFLEKKGYTIVTDKTVTPKVPAYKWFVSYTAEIGKKGYAHRRIFHDGTFFIAAIIGDKLTESLINAIRDQIEELHSGENKTIRGLALLQINLLYG